MAAVERYSFTLLDGKRHDRQAFSCGEPSLDNYLQKRASQDVKKRAAAVHVLSAKYSPSIILGYYTLTASSITSNDIPQALQKKLPRYDQVGVTLLGRLAVDETCKGQGLGSLLLMDALHRALRASVQVSSFAVVVDALHEEAKAFYLHYGFIPFEAHPLKLFTPMKTIENELS